MAHIVVEFQTLPTAGNYGGTPVLVNHFLVVDTSGTDDNYPFSVVADCQGFSAAKLVATKLDA